MEAFTIVKWDDLDQEMLYQEVKRFPEEVLDEIIEKQGTQDIPEIVVRTVFLIREKQFPGDDFLDPEDTMMRLMPSAIIEPPQKVKRIKANSAVHPPKTKEEASNFGKNLKITPEQKIKKVSGNLTFYVKIGGILSNAKNQKPSVTLEVGQVIYLWGYSFPFVVLGLSCKKLSANWKIIARPLGKDEKASINEKTQQIFRNPNRKAGASLRKGSGEWIRTGIDHLIHIVDGVLESIFNNQQKTLLEIIPKSRQEIPEEICRPKKKSAVTERKNSETSEDSEKDYGPLLNSPVSSFHYPAQKCFS